MKHSRAFVLITAIFLLLPGGSWSQGKAGTSFTQSEKQLRLLIVSITEKAAEYWLDNGRKETVAMLNKTGGLFDHGRIFVFACDTKGALIAHKKNKKNPCRYRLSRGKSSSDVFKKKLITTARTSESAWLTCYRFPRKNKKPVKINMYILKKGNIIFCCGYRAD